MFDEEMKNEIHRTYHESNNDARHKYTVPDGISREQHDSSNGEEEDQIEDDTDNTHDVNTAITCTVFRHHQQQQEVQHAGSIFVIHAFFISTAIFFPRLRCCLAKVKFSEKVPCPT